MIAQHTRGKLRFREERFFALIESACTRCTTLSSKTNSPDAVYFRALRGANVVMYPAGLRGNKTLVLHRVDSVRLGKALALLGPPGVHPIIVNPEF